MDLEQIGYFLYMEQQEKEDQEDDKDNVETENALGTSSGHTYTII